MATFKDEELLFLCNLMHIKKEKIFEFDNDGNLVGIPLYDIWTEKNAKDKKNIGELIATIDVEKLRQDYKDDMFDGEISGSEWADMIEAIRNNKDLCNLTLQDINVDDKKSLSVHFTDTDGDAFIVFRGTSPGEWEDNFEGVNVTDTEQQMRALDYINSIDAENITVVGHSKGGNKAKYVSLLSDKVSRCVSFDGQGFSRFFMEKYADLIKANSYKINCYALDYDFVNILLYDIYNNKYFINGNGVSSFEQNHSPNSFFSFYRWNKSSLPQFASSHGTVLINTFYKTEQSESMKKLHLFVNYIASDISEEHREPLFSFLGTISAMALGNKPPYYTEKYTQEEILSYICQPENAEMVGLLAAYLVKYEEYDNGISDAVLKIMKEMGMSDIASWIDKFDKYVGTENLFELIMKKNETGLMLLFIFNAPSYIFNLYRNVTVSYNEHIDLIGDISVSNLTEYNASEDDIIRDYTQATRGSMLKLTDEVSNEFICDVTRWDVWYRIEDWFGYLDIDRYQNNIDGYYRKVIDINGTTNQQMQQIFSNIDATVSGYKKAMATETASLIGLSKKIMEL